MLIFQFHGGFWRGGAASEITNDEKKNNLIFKTLKKGYKIQAAEDKIIYLKKALVKVYEYKKKEDNINIEKT